MPNLLFNQIVITQLLFLELQNIKLIIIHQIVSNVSHMNVNNRKRKKVQAMSSLR